jgi:excisionase family DNA binding protein
MSLTHNTEGMAGALAPASPYLTCMEAAAYLRTTVQGVYSLVKRGRLFPMPGSSRLLFTLERLDDCLKKRRHHGQK